MVGHSFPHPKLYRADLKLPFALVFCRDALVLDNADHFGSNEAATDSSTQPIQHTLDVSKLGACLLATVDKQPPAVRCCSESVSAIARPLLGFGQFKPKRLTVLLRFGLPNAALEAPRQGA